MGVYVLGSNVYFIFMAVNLACIPVSPGGTGSEDPFRFPPFRETLAGATLTELVQDHIPLLPRDKGTLPRRHGRALWDRRRTSGWGRRSGCAGRCRGMSDLTWRAGTRAVFFPPWDDACIA